MRNFIGLPSIPQLSTNSKYKGHTTKVSYELTEQVRVAMECRYRGIKLTKRASLELALSEWLTSEMERSCEGC